MLASTEDAGTPALSIPSASGVPAASSSGLAVPDKPKDWVTRPDGLRHGVWEAPNWAFWVIASLVVIAAITYAVVRIGPKRIGAALGRKRR